MRIEEFEIIDTSWNWEDHYQSLGPGIYETCVTGEGNNQKEAMDDAIAQIIDATDDEAVLEIIQGAEEFDDTEETGESLAEPGDDPPVYYICVRWNPPDSERGEAVEIEILPADQEPASRAG